MSFQNKKNNDHLARSRLLNDPQFICWISHLIIYNQNLNNLTSPKGMKNVWNTQNLAVYYISIYFSHAVYVYIIPEN